MKLPKLFGKMDKKGMVPTPVLAGIGTVFGLFLIGIFVFAFALAGAEMGDTTGNSKCDGYWNEDTNVCQVSQSNTTALAFDGETAVEVIDQSVSGASSFANFSPVLWIITGIGVLIGILITSVGGYFLYKSRN